MLSHVSPCRSSCILRHHFVASSYQNLNPAKPSTRPCYWNGTIIFARRNYGAPRSKQVRTSLAGSPDLDDVEQTDQGTWTFRDVVTTKLARNIGLSERPDEPVLQKAPDTILWNPRTERNLRGPSQENTRQETPPHGADRKTVDPGAEGKSSDPQPSKLLPFVQVAVSNGNLYNPNLVRFIKQIKSQEERIVTVRQILPILQSLVTRTGIELEIDRRRRPNRVAPLQKKLQNARACLHRIEALSHKLGVSVADVDETPLPSDVYGDVKNRWNWNVPGLQRSTRDMAEKDKEHALNFVLRSVEADVSLYKRYGNQSNLKTAIDNLSSIKSWCSLLQKQGSLRNVVLDCTEEPNRFTGLRYSNKTEEFEGLKKWQATQRQHLVETTQTSPTRHDEGGKEQREATYMLRQGHDLKALQLYAVSLYLEEMQLDATCAQLDATCTQFERQVHEEQERTGQTPGRAWKDTVSLPTNWPDVPISVIHYIFDQVLHKLQLIIFAKGPGREWFHKIGTQWHSAESIPVVDPLKIMRLSAFDQTRLKFCQQERDALRVLRNAHAHQSYNFDVRQLRALMSAMCVLFKAISPASEYPVMQNYRELLIDYERRVLRELLSTRHATRQGYSDLTARHEVERNRLDQLRAAPVETEEGQTRWKRQVDKQKTAEYSKYYAETQKMVKSQRKTERVMMQRLASPLRRFTYEMQVRRALRLLPSGEVLDLLQTLKQEFSTTSQTSKSTGPSAQFDKEHASKVESSPKHTLTTRVRLRRHLTSWSGARASIESAHKPSNPTIKVDKKPKFEAPGVKGLNFRRQHGASATNTIQRISRREKRLKNRTSRSWRAD